VAFAAGCGGSGDSSDDGSGGHHGSTSGGDASGGNTSGGSTSTGSSSAPTCDEVCAKVASCPASPLTQGCAEGCASVSDACKKCLAGTCDVQQCEGACNGPSGALDCTEGGQACQFNSDGEDELQCNSKVGRCFDPNPYGYDCSQTPCGFNTDCPDGFACNSATSLCFAK
jgi:hypothetical protein